MAADGFTSFATRISGYGNANPDHRAVGCDGATLTYGALLDRARRTAGRILRLGLEPGGPRRIGIIASNGLDFAIVVAAGQIAGVAVVPLPAIILPDAQARMI